jgi:hypothetical protein
VYDREYHIVWITKYRYAGAWKVGRTGAGEGKNDSGERYVAVLEIPPVESPETAVRVQIVKDFKTRYSN